MPGIAPQCSAVGRGASPPGEQPRPAAFLDRDGTIIADAHYLSRPDQLRLIPGVAEAIRALNDADVPAVVVTNQSGIARGLFTARHYCAVEQALDVMLRDLGALLTASYHCPHLPEISGPCECRKPGTALFRLAAAEHGLELAASLYVGDRWRDASPALALGGMGLLVPAPDTPTPDIAEAAARSMRASTLGEAVDDFLSRARSGRR
ncbi:MAG: D-glycero-alpha-D-manno-heptose-1,7-bisphosphate 7-phosphatase [Gemmatimonadaceae bacterium]